MLNQLLSEMGALRWELRSPAGCQVADLKFRELQRNGALCAYISVAAENKSQENLLFKMLAAIDFEQGDLVPITDILRPLPLLQDSSEQANNFSKIFTIPSLASLIAKPELKRQAWCVLQQFRDYNL